MWKNDHKKMMCIVICLYIYILYICMLSYNAETQNIIDATSKHQQHLSKLPVGPRKAVAEVSKIGNL